MKYIIPFLLINLFMTQSNAQPNKDSLEILLQKEKQDTSRVMLLARLSSAYAISKPDTAILLGMEALFLSQRIKFVNGEVASLNGIGNAYRAVGNLPKAMGAYLQALKLNEKNNNPSGIARNFHDIGTIYNKQGEYHQAIFYLLQAQKLNNNGNFMNLLRLGNSYFGLKQYDSARVYTQQGYEIARKANNQLGTGISLSLMGDIYSETGQKKLALEYYRLSIPYSMLGNDVSLADNFLGIAKLFESEGQVDSTLFYANKAFEINRGKGFTIGVRDAANFLYSFYKNRGYIDKALFYHELAQVAKDSIFSLQRINQLQSLSFDEKLRQMEITTAELRSNEERNHNLQYAAIAVGLITFVILFVFLSHSIVVKTKFIEFFGVLGLLSVFEFINLFIHPYLAHATNDSPVLMLLILIAIGALLVPMHHKLEKWMTSVMVEKNKKIRLEAAKRTIQGLEG